ncbi:MULTISPECIES: DUF484 family protein [Alteromonadaceae]|jgi:uncharacterized protein YigA (DUF484 family)|uniref:DUF484 family protein n=1 Tax=Brumicola blandensis TaxID=3075611 RepID=A0AAW8R234_9ALTE|nr:MULTISPECIES: DUF484 family protein [unclassified Alteromonas]MDT0582188.1 DUF484 family protein [Alteromonas sp. W409]MDT0627856.1 DUF484 family protein [Alteromonas sp. W364]
MNKSSVKGNTAQALAQDYTPSLVTEEEVREYILNNKDFFVKNPDVAEKVQIPHKQKGSVSLVELQSDQLRKKVRQLSFKLSQLISVAKQNEAIYRVYADLNLRLLRCTEFAEMQYTIEETLQDELDMSAASIKPFKGMFALPEIQQRLFMEKRFKDSDFFFGRLSQHEKQLLFGDGIAESVALVLLGDQRDLGILAIGSADPIHFTPDMDTLLIRQLQEFLNVAMPDLLHY